MSFQISGLPATAFSSLFSMSDAELVARGARRLIADRCPGFPCRVSLRDAESGEAVILAHYEHHPVPTPYRASFAVFVRVGAGEAHPTVDEVPQSIRTRLLSVRAFDRDGMMVDADVVDGGALESLVERFFAEPVVAYLHLHNARPGCFAARVDRA